MGRGAVPGISRTERGIDVYRSRSRAPRNRRAARVRSYTWAGHPTTGCCGSRLSCQQFVGDRGSVLFVVSQQTYSTMPHDSPEHQCRPRLRTRQNELQDMPQRAAVLRLSLRGRDDQRDHCTAPGSRHPRDQRTSLAGQPCGDAAGFRHLELFCLERSPWVVLRIEPRQFRVTKSCLKIRVPRTTRSAVCRIAPDSRTGRDTAPHA